MENEKRSGILRNFKSIYFYLVCFVTLMIIIYNAAQLVYDATEIIFPTTYTPAKIDMVRMYQGDEFIKKSVSLEEFIKMQQEQIQNEQKRQKIYAIKRTLKEVTFLLICIPLYLYHWRKIKDE